MFLSFFNFPHVMSLSFSSAFPRFFASLSRFFFQFLLFTLFGKNKICLINILVHDYKVACVCVSVAFHRHPFIQSLTYASNNPHSLSRTHTLTHSSFIRPFSHSVNTAQENEIFISFPPPPLSLCYSTSQHNTYVSVISSSLTHNKNMYVTLPSF